MNEQFLLYAGIGVLIGYALTRGQAQNGSQVAPDVAEQLPQEKTPDSGVSGKGYLYPGGPSGHWVNDRQMKQYKEQFPAV